MKVIKVIDMYTNMLLIKIECVDDRLVKPLVKAFKKQKYLNVVEEEI